MYLVYDYRTEVAGDGIVRGCIVVMTKQQVKWVLPESIGIVVALIFRIWCNGVFAGSFFAVVYPGVYGFLIAVMLIRLCSKLWQILHHEKGDDKDEDL